MRLFPERHIECWRYDEEDHYVLGVVVPMPYVTAWSDSMLRDTLITPEMLGYREVARDPAWRVTRYARPWLLWAILRGAAAVSSQFWRAMVVLHRWHIVRASVPEGVAVRWYNLRTWPWKGR